MQFGLMSNSIEFASVKNDFCARFGLTSSKTIYVGPILIRNKRIMLDEIVT